MRTYYRIMFLGAAIMLATAALAQNDQKVAPTAPDTGLEKQAAPTTTSTGPANICVELGAYAKAQEEKQQSEKQNPSPDPNKTQSAQKESEVDKPQHQSGITKPVPTDGDKAGPKLAPADLRIIAEKDDREECRTIVNKLRRAGTALPPALIALAALRTLQ